jgi:hypothetical protein
MRCALRGVPVRSGKKKKKSQKPWQAPTEPSLSLTRLFVRLNIANAVSALTATCITSLHIIAPPPHRLIG